MNPWFGGEVGTSELHSVRGDLEQKVIDTWLDLPETPDPTVFDEAASVSRGDCVVGNRVACSVSAKEDRMVSRYSFDSSCVATGAQRDRPNCASDIQGSWYTDYTVRLLPHLPYKGMPGSWVQ